MPTRFSQRIPVLLSIPAVVLIAGCSERAPASPTAPAVVESALITAEPMTAAPEFLPISVCRPEPSFGVRLIITIGGGREFFVRRLRFSFRDRLGAVSVPFATAIATSRFNSVPIPTSAPIPFPTSAPIPIAGALTIDHQRITAGTSRTQGVFLQFGCGVPPSGTLIISVDTTDARGDSATSLVHVRVGK